MGKVITLRPGKNCKHPKSKRIPMGSHTYCTACRQKICC